MRIIKRLKLPKCKETQQPQDTPQARQYRPTGATTYWATYYNSNTFTTSTTTNTWSSVFTPWYEDF